MLKSICVLMLGCSCGISLEAAQEPRQEPSDPQTPNEDFNSADILRAHNRERKIAKLPPFTLSKKLDKAALLHANDMAEHKMMSHEGTNKSTPFERIKKTAYQFRGAAENVAKWQTTVEMVMDDWMKSPHHRENILGDYTEIGVAVVRDSDGHSYWCVDFGKPWPEIDPAKAAEEVVSLINQEREKADKNPLMLEPKLSGPANWQANLMASGRSLNAEESKTENVFVKIKEEGLKYKSVAQTGAVGLAAPEDLVKYLMDQPDYRKALLDDFKDAGVGYSKDDKGNPYWCILFGQVNRNR